MSTKYNEKCVNAQCKACNNPTWGGSVDRETWRRVIDKKWGKGTYDMIDLASRSIKKYSKFEIDALAKYYREEGRKIANEKGLEI